MMEEKIDPTFLFPSHSLNVQSRVQEKKVDIRKSRSLSPPLGRDSARNLKKLLSLEQPITFNSKNDLKEFVGAVERNQLNIVYDLHSHFANSIARQNFPVEGYFRDLSKDRSNENLPTVEGHIDMSNIESPLQVDYINASLIEDGPRSYIATQHPLENSILDFWKMILHYKPNAIVMLDGSEYLHKQKYPKYWPEGAEVLQWNIGSYSITVSSQSESQLSFGRLARLAVTLSTTQETVQQWSLWHVRCDCWQDQSEITLEQFEALWRVVKEVEANTPRLVVHCIGGIGRTGTFITVDMAINRLNRSQGVSIDNIILELRKRRMNIVAHPLHYQFCYKAALELCEHLQ